MPLSGRRPGQPIPTIWFGMRCDFTRAAIEGALASGRIVVAAVVLPRGPVPHAAGWPAPPFDRWARGIGVEVIEIDRLVGADLVAILALIREQEIPLGVGACFPLKVPAAIRDALPGGVLNIHPSLLPALRGPEPVFHAYRLGLAETGVTVHLMDDGWDTGPVIARERVAIPDTGRAEVFESMLAGRGGRLLGSVVAGWLDKSVPAMPQDDTRSSWARVPTARDRVIPAELTVAQATRFLAACGPLLTEDEDGSLVEVNAKAAMEPRDWRDLRNDRNIARVSLRDGEPWLSGVGRGDRRDG